ncbi:hypothetical protein JCM10207_007997 [Rhodosporidiobolus poonsookiae]
MDRTATALPALDTLPPELLHHILLLALPTRSFSARTPRLRQLRALALVCRSWYTIVERDFLREVWLFSINQAESFLEAVGSRGDRVEVLYFDNQQDDYGVQKVFEAVVALCPRLRQIRLSYCWLDLTCLETLADLQHLGVFNSTIALSRPVIFPRLKDLSSFFSTASAITQGHLHSSSALPSLRVYATRHAPSLPPAANPDEPDFLVPPSALVNRLSLVLYNDLSAARSLSSDIHLFDQGLPAVDSQLQHLVASYSGLPPFLRMHHQDYDPELQQLVAIFKDPPSFRIVYDELPWMSSDSLVTPRVCEVLAGLGSACLE